MSWESEAEGYLPISVIEKYAFCPRQAYLQFVEREDPDHLYLALGSILHQRVQQGDKDQIGDTEITRSVHLVNHQLRIYGIADVIEFRGEKPFPVEYKHGGGKKRQSQWLQLTLQTLCLEEMLKVHIPEGAIYHGSSKQRERVAIDDTLRQRALKTCAEAHQTLSQTEAPKPKWFTGCRRCSLLDVCMPKVI